MPGPDPFASAKANLRDTIKWLATTFAALAAAVAAGASLGGVSALNTQDLAIALVGGALALLCILGATGATLSLLTSESFTLTDLAKDPNVKARLNEVAKDLLSPELVDVDAFLSLRDKVIKELRAHSNNPTSQQYRDASAYFAKLEVEANRLVNFAHFESLRLRFAAKRRRLFVLAIGAIVGLGVFAAFSDGQKNLSAADRSDAIAAKIMPGPGWTDVGRAFEASCGSGPLSGFLVHSASTRPGWITLKLSAPAPCAGLEIVLPGQVVAVPAVVPQVQSN